MYMVLSVLVTVVSVFRRGGDGVAESNSLDWVALLVQSYSSNAAGLFCVVCGVKDHIVCYVIHHF